ncbi:NADP-dependent oxidoreductase domain-containing protein [Massariosphaeria phaeospora]|uniref:NADP-dependent oxidoreductase domain-containing protein n=1 Tax=Massariosphaeria phaeospora TaxID=100035 RepID=A0A7C8MAN5_9PLEO|nr:NADP-dependent oxidoreductase domain-containing protein [Massariosphaeria phaeospora]
MPTILGKEVGSIGYGMAGLSIPPYMPPEEQAIECLRTAADLGCLCFNAGEFYGHPLYNSLTLLHRFWAKYPQYADRVLVNVKGAMLPTFAPSGDSAVIRKSVENCLSQLEGRGKIDMFELARIDVDVTLETQLGALGQLVGEGKIGGVALTEVNAETIRKAVKIVKIVAVEIELSLWCTDPLYNGILDTCAELEIPVMAYCPVGRGVLTGQLNSFEDIPEGDYRRMLPRYQPENLDQNRKLVEQVAKLAQKKGCTTAQVALGWLLGLSKQEGRPVIIPIPGSTNVHHIRENAATVALDEEEMNLVDAIIAENPVAGERYHPHGMKMVNL